MTSKDMILTLVFYLGLTLSQASGSCLHPNMTWVSEDILDSVHPVETPYQCQAICVDTEGCAAFTWTTADNQQLQLHCFLFGSTDNQTSCQECVSGTGPEECSHQISTNTNTPAMEGIIISGGEGAYTSVEVFNPSDKTGCLLPSLPDLRTGHTMDSLELCGGFFTSTCITFTSGQWVTSHALTEERSDHTSWSTDAGIILMGGFYSDMTTEIISQGEYEGVPWFDMQYNTMYACSIVDSGTLLVTGGEYTQRTVSRYNTAGFVEDLPALNEGRYYHGCGAYTGDTGEQVFLVTGGRDDGFPLLSSTEVWSTSSSSWTMATNLPRSMGSMRGVTLGGVLYMTGGAGGDFYDDIYQWTGAAWEEVGKMKMARYSHAVSTITLDDDAIQYCG